MLFGFGDSFTQGVCDGGKVEQSFLQIIGKKLNMSVKNYAHWGFCMEDIMSTMTKHLKYIKEGDVVILGGTTIDRMLFPVHYDTIKHYHGRESTVSRKSVTGVSYPTIESFFESKQYKKIDREEWVDGDGSEFADFIRGLDNPEEFGYKPKQVYLDLFFNQWNNLKRPFHESFETFYSDWFEHWEDYFVSRNIRFYHWHNRWWRSVPKEMLCECKHWNDEGHKYFANIAWDYMDRYYSGEIKVPESAI